LRLLAHFVKFPHVIYKQSITIEERPHIQAIKPTGISLKD
jgi:hypothetical protein